jgi:hypothetical protein
MVLIVDEMDILDGDADADAATISFCPVRAPSQLRSVLLSRVDALIPAA